MAGERVDLVRDRRGVMWDALLYAPTVFGLGSAALILWYQGNQSFGYLLLFLASFFLIQGVHRVLGRLILLPASPISIDITKQRVSLQLRNGQCIELVKNLRYFSDFAGKSFGLTGVDLNGARKQYVFHKGQFPSDELFRKIGAALKIYA
jgi:hypothetical protein